jgi:uncharacterized protein YukE
VGIPLDPPYLPEVPGDPAGMRALASSLRGYASSAAQLASSVAGDVDAMTFEGPAAGPFREGIRAATTAYERAGEELLDAASTLERSATEVERLQREREQRLAAMWEDYHAARQALIDQGIRVA